MPYGHVAREPLTGVRVLDLTRLLPGAYATLLLADLGAEVIKIEDPRGGDTGRRMPSSFAVLNRNKQSVTLNLRAPDARSILDALLAGADVFVDSFRPRAARRLGVDAVSLRDRHPRLVCASISGFGQTGPWADVAAHDINYQALAGLLMRDGRATMPGPLIGDIGAAMQTTLGILAALIDRQRTGAGAFVDVSIYGAALAWTNFPSTEDLASACYQLYETSDGRWLALGALEPKFWAAFCEGIERPDFIPLQHAGGADGARVLEDVRKVMRTRTREEWLARFAGADVCLTPVNARHEPLADPHATAPPQTRNAPELGRDTDRILESIGVDAVRREHLRRSGVI